MPTEPAPFAPLGAHLDGDGATFAVASDLAEAIEVCLFDEAGEERRHLLHPAGPGRFAGRVAGVTAGTAYGLRVDGPWAPRRGHRCNPAKLLVDPYARRIDGALSFHPSLLGHDPADPTLPSPSDSGPHTLRSVVVDPAFDWEGDRPPRVPLADTVIFETHVKGLTRLHPEVPPELRGTYAGLAHPAVVEHLTALGVTVVELLPVHRFTRDQHLLGTDRPNYWGYNSIGFFAPQPDYAAGDDPVAEFKAMVRDLHRAGLEVILDVVYNHTSEGDHLGPTLCFRGLDNAAWYRLDPADPSRYLNWTGTGNTVDISHPSVLKTVMDSLRYWVEDMHVDGFRFDLATVLGRTSPAFDPRGGFFSAVAQDPVLERVKLIAEPWDMGPGGYRLGGFPRGWSEWNDRFRDTVRDFWRSAEGSLAAFATRITGSSDLFEASGRSPTASINYVTSHDGFTLTDLVSYDRRHNQANGEGNRDGHPDNRSWNSGVEGPTTDPDVEALRGRRKRALIATVLLSQGVPMILGGDEIGRTQGGNNNPYNQDNETTWHDWKGADTELTEFVRRVVGLRRRHPTFRRTAWLHEHPEPESDHVGWFTPAGEEMTPEDWKAPFARSVALYLDGRVIHSTEGAVSDDDFLLLFNAYREPIEFMVPDGRDGWELVLDTALPAREEEPVGESLRVADFGLVVLRRSREAGGRPARGRSGRTGT